MPRKRNIPIKKSIFRDVFNLTSGYAISQAVIVLASPLLSRLYTPEEFGVFFFFITTASLLSVLATGGYEKAIVVAPEEKSAADIFRYAVMLSLAVTAIAALITAFLSLAGDRLFEYKAERDMLWLVPLFAFFFGLFRLIQNINIRNNRFGAVSSSFIIRASSQTATQAGLGLAGMSSPGLIFGSCLGQIIAVFSQSFRRQYFRGLFCRSNIEEAKKRAAEFIDFPKYRMSSDLMNEASIQAPVYILKSFFGNATTGLYSFPQKILYQPSKFISQAVADVYFNKASELNNRSKSLGELTFSTYKTLLVLGVMPFIVIILWGPEIFSFVFSGEWRESGRIAGYLSPWMFLVFIGSPVSSVFLVGKKLRLSFMLNLALLVSRLLCLMLGAMIFHDAEMTIILFSAVSSLYWVISILYSLHFAGVSLKKAVTVSMLVIIASTALLLPFKLLIG